LPITVKDIVVDFEVKGKQTFKLNVPLEVAAQASQGEYQVGLQFYGPHGTPVGEALKFTVKVKDGADESQLYNTATILAEAGMGSFDECV